MEKITIYQKPTCSTCREVYKILKESGVDFTSVDYYINPIRKIKLKDLLRKMGLRPRDILRSKEPIYRELNLQHAQLSDDEILDILVKYPDLIQRPIVEKGERAVLARPAETIKILL